LSYDINDFRQSAIGAFTAIVVFFAIRGNNPLEFDPVQGFIITVAVLVIYYNGYRMKNKLQHFVLNFVVSFLISAVLANVFNLLEWEKVFTFDVFGSLVIVGTWVAFISALLFDKYNFTSPLKRYYVRGK
jgi:hypothetical protein